MLSEKTEIIIDNINISTKTISIAKDTIIMRDGVEISRGRCRCAFYPGQIENVKAYAGVVDTSPEIIYLNSVWSQDVIDSYQTILNTQVQVG